jgi:hypothetical protein
MREISGIADKLSASGGCLVTHSSETYLGYHNTRHEDLINNFRVCVCVCGGGGPAKWIMLLGRKRFFGGKTKGKYEWLVCGAG